MDSIVKFISTKEKKLPELEIVNGQLIFVEDTRRVYLDFHNQRIPYNNIIYLSTEAQRISLTSPVPAFYFTFVKSLWLEKMVKLYLLFEK